MKKISYSTTVTMLDYNKHYEGIINFDGVGHFTYEIKCPPNAKDLDSVNSPIDIHVSATDMYNNQLSDLSDDVKLFFIMTGLRGAILIEAMNPYLGTDVEVLHANNEGSFGETIELVSTLDDFLSEYQI